jgi:acyl-CoA dehydrogenase
MTAARQPTPAHVSLCKAQCNDTFLLATKEAVQMFGGIGMTDEHDIGFFLKRALVAAQTLGDSAWHRDRWGRVHGF